MQPFISLLYSQLGYYEDGEKQAFARLAANAAPLPDDAAFRLYPADGGPAVLERRCALWGEKWRSVWYTLNFTDFTSPGRYVLELCGRRSMPFEIGGHVLANSSLRLIALDQLEPRKEAGVGGWRDCGSKIRELSSIVITVLALKDLWQSDTLLPYDRPRLISEILRGGDAICASEEKWPDTPEKDGRFNHDAFRMTQYGTTDYHNWHDTAFAIQGLTAAWQVARHTAPAQAAQYLDCARRAFQNAVRRPYQLAGDISGRDHPDIKYTDDFRDFVDGLARRAYGIGEADWRIPLSLRTKDKLAFAKACLSLYDIDGWPEYLDTAVRYIDAVCDRQCLAPGHPGFGFFYEFEADDRGFMLEFGHNHKYLMGNIEPCDLSPLARIAALPGDGARCAKYMRALRLYADGYVRRAAELTPLSLYPQTVYPANRGGVSFFKMTVHGFTCLYGQIARNLFELAAYLGDEALSRIAERNLLFPVGRNPGMPRGWDAEAWDCLSLIKGVGGHSFGGVHTLSEIPDGSAMNGFAPAQFDIETPFEDIPDEPLGFYHPDGTLCFNEDYLPHSHGYVRGVAAREAPFTLRIRLQKDGQPVSGCILIRWADGEDQRLRSAKDGMAVLQCARMYRKGVVSCPDWPMCGEETVETLPGGETSLLFDPDDCLRINLLREDAQTLRALVKNPGDTAAQVSLPLWTCGARVTPDRLESLVPPHGEKAFTLHMDIDAPSAWIVCLPPRAAGQLPRLMINGIQYHKSEVSKHAT